MKALKICFALLLTLTTVFSMAACGEKQEGTPTAAAPVPETTEAKDYSTFAGIVADPKGWYEDFMALPIANDQMTEQELRQLCVDAFKANLSFEWTPNAPIQYTFELLDRYSDVYLPTGIAYSGLMYATGVTNTSRGNIWKALDYYDVETGVLDVEAMGDLDNIIGTLSSACAAGVIMAYNRVSDNHGLKGMSSFNKEDANIVPVGPYTYGPHTYNYNFGSRTASNEIIAANGNEVMYESLALMLPADGLYSSSSWHVMMCSQDPVVVRKADGKIDPFQSYMLICEQGATGTKGDSLNYNQSNGVAMRPLGTIDKQYTFADLISKGYIPFTLKEFLGEEPVEEGKAWVGKLTEELENGADIDVQTLFSKNLCSNYALCTMQVQVKAPDGTVLVSYKPPINSAHKAYYTMEYPLAGLLQQERVAPYADGKNTIHIYAQLANGEKLEAYSTVLKMKAE